MSFTRDISVSLLLHGSLIAGALLIGGISISQQNRLIDILLVSETSSDSNLHPTVRSSAFLRKKISEQSHPEREQGRWQANSTSPYSASQKDQPTSAAPNEVGPFEGNPEAANRDELGDYSPATSMKNSKGEKEHYYSQNSSLTSSPQLDNRAAHLIKTKIERSLIYPYLAIRKKIEGTVTAGFTINVKGQPENISIVRSSGSPILDKAAQDTIIRAAPFPAITGSIEIPITYRLDK